MSTSNEVVRVHAQNGKKRHQWAWIGLLVLGGILSAAQTASAGVLSEIPDAVDQALGTASGTGGYILSAGVLVSVGLALAVAGKRANMEATVIVLIAVEGVLVAVTWLPTWVLLLTGLLVAFFFASKIASVIPGRG